MACFRVDRQTSLRFLVLLLGFWKPRKSDVRILTFTQLMTGRSYVYLSCGHVDWYMMTKEPRFENEKASRLE